MFISPNFAAMIAEALAQAALFNSLMRGSPSYTSRSRSPGDRSHKRWKRTRSAGRR